MKAPSTLPRSRVPTEHLLLPVEPRFIWLTLFLAWLLNLLPWGQVGGIPDALAICLVFWSVHEPRRVGMLTAFIFGILMDVHGSARLGEHALSYTLMVYLALAAVVVLALAAGLARAAGFFRLRTHGILYPRLARRHLARLVVGAEQRDLGPAVAAGGLDPASSPA